VALAAGDPHAQDLKRAEAYLGKVPRPSEGARNTTLNELAYLLGRKFVLDELNHRTLCFQWCATCRPPLPEGEALATIRSAWTALSAKGELGADWEPPKGRREHLRQESQPPDGAEDDGVNLAACVASVALNAPETFKPVEYISTGYPSLDRVLGGGWARGESTSEFGASTMGKTCLAVNQAVRIAEQGFPIGYVSLEMRAKDVWQLATCIVGDVPRQHVRHATLTDLEAARLREAKERLAAWPLYVIDRTQIPTDPENPEAPTMAAVSAILRAGVAFFGWRAAFLDYLGKVGPFGQDELQRLSRLTNWACDTAQRLDFHFVCLAQTNKAAWNRLDADGKRDVSLEDSKGPVEVIADFDYAIGVVRQDWNTDAPLDPSPMKVAVRKARYAPGGAVSLMFHRSTGRIVEADTGGATDDA
jgi:hypothetical protein